MSVPKWGIKDRWPNKSIEILDLSDGGGKFAFGHIPFNTFAVELLEQEGINVETEPVPSFYGVRHEWWHIRFDIFKEYAWVYERRASHGPFVAPVTVWGES